MSYIIILVLFCFCSFVCLFIVVVVFFVLFFYISGFPSTLEGNGTGLVMAVSFVLGFVVSQK